MTEYEHTADHADCVGPGCWEQRLDAAGGPTPITLVGVTNAVHRGTLESTADGPDFNWAKLSGRFDHAVVLAAEDRRQAFRAAADNMQRVDDGPIGSLAEWRKTLSKAAKFAHSALGMTRPQIAQWLEIQPTALDVILGTPDEIKAAAVAALEAGATVRQAADATGLRYEACRRIAKEHGLELRPGGSPIPAEVMHDIKTLLADGYSPTQVVNTVKSVHGDGAAMVTAAGVKQGAYRSRQSAQVELDLPDFAGELVSA